MNGDDLFLPSENDEDLFMPVEAGKILGGPGKPIKASTLQYWRTSEKGPEYIKLSWKEVRYTRGALRRYLASRKNLGGRNRVEVAHA
ncbi:hypothetical protein [Rhizobium sp.]